MMVLILAFWNLTLKCQWAENENQPREGNNISISIQKYWKHKTRLKTGMKIEHSEIFGQWDLNTYI